MQTVLGAGGAIGDALAAALPQYTQSVRLVSRSPKKVVGNEELFPADLTQLAAVEKAVAGSGIVYLTAGLPYKLSVWQQQWLVIMSNTIAACKKHGCKLVFFDNNYLYAAEEMPHQTEQSKVAPPSKKGVVRAGLVKQLEAAMAAGLPALIARAPDFYGPGIKTSMLQETVYANLKKGKKAMLLGPPHVKHNYIFTPDAGAATALLGNTADAYGQTWHLPASEVMTGRKWVELFAQALNVTPRYTQLPAFFLKLGGLFNPMLREVPEMLYQSKQDYFFESTKFAQRFPQFKATPAARAVQQIADTDK